MPEFLLIFLLVAELACVFVSKALFGFLMPFTVALQLVLFLLSRPLRKKYGLDYGSLVEETCAFLFMTIPLDLIVFLVAQRCCGFL